MKKRKNEKPIQWDLISAIRFADLMRWAAERIPDFWEWLFM